MVMCRCLGPDASAVMNGRLMSVEEVEDSSHLAFSAACGQAERDGRLCQRQGTKRWPAASGAVSTTKHYARLQQPPRWRQATRTKRCMLGKITAVHACMHACMHLTLHLPPGGSLLRSMQSAARAHRLIDTTRNVATVPVPTGAIESQHHMSHARWCHQILAQLAGN